MFWVKKPTESSPYAESKGGKYRIAVTKSTCRETGEATFKYTAFKNVGPGGAFDKVWDMLGDPSDNADDVKKRCVSDDRGERQAIRGAGKKRRR